MPESMEFVVRHNGKEKVILLEPKAFKSGTKGFYFRERMILPDGADYHCQIILSRKV